MERGCSVDSARAFQDGTVLKIHPSYAKVPLLAYCLVPVLNQAFCYALTIGDGRVNSGDFFISSAMDEPRTRHVGSFSLAITAIALVLLALIRHVAVHVAAKSTPSSVAARVRISSALALVCAFIASIGTIGVGAFNVSFDPAVHYPLALLQTNAILAYMCLQCRIDWLLMRQGARGSPSPALTACHKVRLGLCIIGVLAVPSGLCALHTGSHVVAGIVEITLFVAVISFFWTWALGASTGYAMELALQVGPIDGHAASGGSASEPEA